MKWIMYSLAFLASTTFCLTTQAQEKKPIPTKEEIIAAGKIEDVFDKKFRFGLSYHFYWGTIKGNDLPDRYFAKPCVGFNFRAEYYPLSFAGAGLGIGYQQRGTGVRNPDNFGGSFAHPWVKPNLVETDSTYAQKLRINTFEIPLTLLLRTPNEVIKGIRLSAAAGITWIHNFRTNDIWMDVVGGFHEERFVTSQYLRDDLGYQLSFGGDINAGHANVFQVHFVYTKGMKNIYAAGQGDGRQVTLGLRTAFLF